MSSSRLYYRAWKKLFYQFEVNFFLLRNYGALACGWLNNRSRNIVLLIEQFPDKSENQDRNKIQMTLQSFFIN